nr:metallothionein-like protein type 2 [Zea mays]ACG42743.1 metallothionein-like protein type 2 [Zea mays]
MYPDMAEQVTTTTQTLIMGVAPSKGGFEAAAGAENGGCKCGANCTCDPCTCK